ncbi:MAG: hypothetical protein K2I93_03970 [Oscillospiraceae bacterium]|nr:hypothetical protein [Oscillospiraceae bacterium]
MASIIRIKDDLFRAWVGISEAMEEKGESRQAVNIMYACYRILRDGFSDGMVKELKDLIGDYEHHKSDIPFEYRVVYLTSEGLYYKYFESFGDAFQSYASLMNVAGAISCKQLTETYKHTKIQKYNGKTKRYEEIR